MKFAASDPIFACPLGKKSAHMIDPGTVHERMMSQRQVFVPKYDGTRMLIQP